eukprot:3215797-Rhodomonas_salina.1
MRMRVGTATMLEDEGAERRSEVAWIGCGCRCGVLGVSSLQLCFEGWSARGSGPGSKVKV